MRYYFMSLLSTLSSMVFCGILHFFFAFGRTFKNQIHRSPIIENLQSRQPLQQNENTTAKNTKTAPV